jgi:hypothetical protein
MKYSFKHNEDWIIIEVEGNNDTLTNFSNSGWTSHNVQEIIDGVKSTDNTEKEYRWGNEDLIVISNKHAVFFIDLLSTRGSGKQVREKQDLDLTHDEFIKFLEDFKEFIEKEV